MSGWPRAVGALAVADLRDRARRPAFLVIVLAAAVLGYLAAPPLSADYTMVKFGAFRGDYDSAYLGAMMAAIGGLWLPLFGFYVVKDALARDTVTGVGRVLATTPLDRVGYLVGKFLSNLLVLAAMAGVLAVTAPVMQLLRGESHDVDLLALWLPFLPLCLPVLAVAAAAALVAESIPLLRGAVGNLAWFFTFPLVYVAVLGPTAWSSLQESVEADLRAQHPDVTDTGISVGLTLEEGGLDRFTWSGLDVTPELLAPALGIVLLAALVAMLPALWLPRFGTHPSSGGRPLLDRVLAGAGVAGEPGSPAGLAAGTPDGASAEPGGGAFAATGRPRVAVERGAAFGRMVNGELRLLLKGRPVWWWLALVGVTVAALVVGGGDGVDVVLLLAWLLPLPLWSRLGTYQHEHRVHALLAAGPAPRGLLLATWLAGVAVAALAGAGPLLRMLLGADGVGVAAWAAGALFIPAVALLLGSLSRGARLFQVCYVALSYLILNEVGSVDIMGAIRDGGQLAGPAPWLVAAGAAASLAGALLVHELRHSRR